MKVAKRILIKFLILIVVVGLGGGGAVAYQGYRQGTADFAVNRYLTMLTDNNSEKAYSLLDQSEEIKFTKDEFAKALEGKKYSLYASFQAEAQEKRRDNDGNEYADYHVKFFDAADELQAEEDFTVKKQAEPLFGVFDNWKILGDHCMIRDFKITVPTGSTVYLDAVEADASWASTGENASVTTYRIPTILPGETSLTVRHPVLESVNTTVDTTGNAVDYSDKMPLKASAQDECKELGVAAVKNLMTAAVKNDKKEIGDSLENCKDAAESFVEKQAEVLHPEEAAFKSIAVSAFAAQFSEPVFSEDGTIQTEMTFSYRYRVKKDVTTESEDQVQEDGTPVQIVETEAVAGNSTAKMTMSYKDGGWSVTKFEIPVTNG